MKVDLIYTEDCQEGIPRKLPDESVDFMPTDPPYGIGFMGREWDKFNQIVNPQGAYEAKKGFKKLPRQSSAFIREFFTPIWKECFRVLKPGAFAFVMCIPRQDCLARQVISLEDAGFNVSFSPIFHAFASGFPKAQNISKVIDKRLGVKQKIIGEYQAPDGGRRDLSKHKPHKEARQADHEYGYETSGFRPITGATSPQAQALDGSFAGMQLKPAVEVIIVAMKPLSEKTYLDQALRNRKGIVWLDQGRIPYRAQKDIDEASNKNRHADFGSGPRDNKIYGIDKRSRAGQGNYDASRGRFPANLLVSDDVLNDGKVSKTNSKGGIRKASNEFGQDSSWNAHRNIDSFRQGISDSGSFSRYFSLDAWFDKRFKELPKSVQKTFPFLIVPKAPKSEKNRGCEELYWEKDNSGFGHHQIDKQRWIWLGKEEKRIYQETGSRISLRAKGNIHPTVKPLKLFCYLITLGSHEGDVILDPFMGSGTTAVAARMLARHYVGWETGLENVKIAKARLSILEPLLI